MCMNNHHQLGWGISELTVLEKRTPESWEKSYGAWFHMNCLRRAVTSITFPWERSCLAWKKFTGSRIRTVVYMLLIRSQSLCTISENLYIQPNQNTWRQCVFLQTHGYVVTSFMMQLCFFMSNFLFNVITMMIVLWLDFSHKNHLVNVMKSVMNNLLLSPKNSWKMSRYLFRSVQGFGNQVRRIKCWYLMFLQTTDTSRFMCVTGLHTILTFIQ